MRPGPRAEATLGVLRAHWRELWGAPSAPPEAARAGAVWRRAPPGGRWREGTAPSLALPPPPPASAQHGDAQQGGAATNPRHPAGAGGAREAEAGAGGEGRHRGCPGETPALAPVSGPGPSRSGPFVTPRAQRGGWESAGLRTAAHCAARRRLGFPAGRIWRREPGAGRGAGEGREARPAEAWREVGARGWGLPCGSLRRRGSASPAGWMRAGGSGLLERLGGKRAGRVEEIGSGLAVGSGEVG